MSELRIASRYAKSLVELAQQQKNLNLIYEDICMILDISNNNHDFHTLIKSPIIKSEVKNDIIIKIFNNTQSLTKQFLTIIVNARRESILPEVCNSFIDMYNDINGIAPALVVTALPLDESNIEKIKNYISKTINKSNVQLEIKIDRGIIGGLIIQYKDKLLDMSIKSELHKLKLSLN
ncbi:MAG: ATP synthase F1 subunit delta [Bacteroidia bacterium]|nr:ATP synthase F1 subunit delta [Bacteroidia bacterium]